ncbi:MAG TPA: YqiA/YcfP family alpha/beta fold hydrolase [Vicinamibacterales bacterium]|nr:YqiA/YcfP family alpha/beta fold hydrolase [Vicinamibacterales bacterium]
MPLPPRVPDAVVTVSPVRVIYLHGFASSPLSSKARLFADRLAAHGVAIDIPDFNEPSFETLTVTRMIAQAEAIIVRGAGDEIALVGSSLGAFVAVHAAARRPAVRRLVLLAPALDFASKRLDDLGEDAIARWRESGRLEVFHYGYGRPMSLGYELYADAAAYDAFALQLTQPVLIFQGMRDTVVNPNVARRYARDRTNVTLRLLDDDHQLLASAETIWEEARQFLGIPRLP